MGVFHSGPSFVRVQYYTLILLTPRCAEIIDYESVWLLGMIVVLNNTINHEYFVYKIFHVINFHIE